MICAVCSLVAFFFSSRRRHTSCLSDWSSDVCSSDLLERAWRRHMLLCLLEFSGADGLGRNDFRSLLWHVSNITCNRPGLSCELFAAPKSGGCAACRFEPRRHTHVWSANSETVQKRHSRK